MPACGLQLHSIAFKVTLPFYVKRHAICHLYAMSIGSATYQCVASNTSIHVPKNNKHNCAAADAGIMALCCVQKPNSGQSGLMSLFWQTERLVPLYNCMSGCQGSVLRAHLKQMSCTHVAFCLFYSLSAYVTFLRLPDILLVRDISMLHTVVADACWTV